MSEAEPSTPPRATGTPADADTSMTSASPADAAPLTPAATSEGEADPPAPVVDPAGIPEEQMDNVMVAVGLPTTGSLTPGPGSPKKKKKKKVYAEVDQRTVDEIEAEMVEVRRWILGERELDVGWLEWVKTAGQYGQPRVLDSGRLDALMAQVLARPPLDIIKDVIVLQHGVCILCSPASKRFSLLRAILHCLGWTAHQQGYLAPAPVVLDQGLPRS